MPRKGMKGGYAFSPRFLAWARSNGHADLIEEIEEARTEYRESGAGSSYARYSDEELSTAHHKTASRLNRIATEQDRRHSAIPEPVSTG